MRFLKLCFLYSPVFWGLFICGGFEVLNLSERGRVSSVLYIPRSQRTGLFYYLVFLLPTALSKPYTRLRIKRDGEKANSIDI